MATLSKTMRQALSNQYALETANGIKYALRESWATYRGYEGAAVYFASEAKGERHHAKRVLSYLLTRGEELQSVDVPATEYPLATFTEAFQSAYDLELATTEAIQTIYELAVEEKDYMTVAWLTDPEGLLMIQMAEESEAKTILDRLTSGLNGIGQDADPVDVGLVFLEIDRFVGELVE